MQQFRHQHSDLSGAEVARLDTWMVEIAEAARGTTAKESGDGFRLGAKGSLWIGRSAIFRDFEADLGGRGAFRLLQHVNGLDFADALQAARKWLSGHPGAGRLGTPDDAYDETLEVSEADAARQAFLDTLWAGAAPAEGATLLSAYFSSRGLSVSTVDLAGLRFLPSARGDESALLCAVTDVGGKVVAIQETFITPDGIKSPLEPSRRLTRGPHNWRQRGYVRFGGDEGGSNGAFVCEGVEDALSVRQAVGLVLGTLGVGALGAGKLAPDIRTVTIVRDDDAPGSEADKSLWRGVVRFAAQGVKVKVTPRPSRVFDAASPDVEAATSGKADGTGDHNVAGALKDANDVLRGYGTVGLERLLNTATDEPDDLDRDAVADAASRLEAGGYEIAREQVAELLGWRRKALDDDRKSRRADRAAEIGHAAREIAVNDTPWSDPITDIGLVLDTAVAEVARYVVAPSAVHDTLVLWSSAAHLLHRADLGVQIAPRLGIQSPVKGSGKTTALEAVACLSPRPILAGSITPSSLFRVVELERPTLLIDEADNVIRRDGNPDLLAVLNSGHRRSMAKVLRTEQLPDGSREVVTFNTFTGIAFAGLSKLPETLQDRSLVLSLRKALPGEVRAHLVNGESPVLLECRRKLVRWAADLAELPPVAMPSELANRLGDNWRLLFQIAELASGGWPQRVRLAALGRPTDDGGETVALLAAIWQIFREKGVVRMHSQSLIEALQQVDEGRWTQIDHGRPLSEYYLRERLKDLLPQDEDAKKARRWREGGGETRYGYHERHLADGWRRYLGRSTPSGRSYDETCSPDPPPKDGFSSDPSDAKAENATRSDGYSASDGSAGPASDHASAERASDPTHPSDAQSDAPKATEKQHDGENASDASDDLAQSGGARAQTFPSGAKRRRGRRENGAEVTRGGEP